MTSPRILAVPAAFIIAAMVVLIPATAASANTPPNPYSPSGSSWVDVPAGERVYFENFGQNFDDYAIFYVGAGITCTNGGVTATGPFLTAIDVSDAECVDATSAPFDPIDVPTRLGSVPFGFPINFYGTTYSSGYPNTNGGIYFDSPDNSYDETLAYLASVSLSSAMFPFGADLYYAEAESNFWMAQTVVDGATAVVFGWEKFHNCCNSGVTSDDMSFQLVLIDAGAGDFNAWFNFASVAAFDQGYDAPAVLIDLFSGVTVGSNVLTAVSVAGMTSTCTDADYEELGTATDTVFIDDLGPLYFKLDDAAVRTVSVWSDAGCSVPINVNVIQDLATDLAAYVQFVDDSATAYLSIGSGWSTYDPTTAVVSATELLPNIDSVELDNGAANPLIARSLNTTVPGRFVIGQRGGVTVTDPGTLGVTTGSGEAAGGLPPTGARDLAGFGMLAGALLVAGAGLVWARASRRRMPAIES